MPSDMRNPSRFGPGCSHFFVRGECAVPGAGAGSLGTVRAGLGAEAVCSHRRRKGRVGGPFTSVKLTF